PKHPFMQLMQITEDYCYRNADAIASVLPYAEGYYREHGAKKEIGYFPNSIDLHSWNYSSELLNQDQLSQIEQLKQAGKFLVGYTGTVGIANAVDTLIDAAERLKQHDNIVFVIVGDGDQLQTLKSKVQQLQLNNVVFLGKISKDEIPAMLSYFDTVYLGWKNIDLYKFGVSPNKVMDYMMAKKPIIHAITSDNDIVKEYDCGISVEAENCEALAKAVLNLSNCDSEQLEEMGNRGYEKVINNHTYEQVAQQYVTFLRNI
ncbi:MAG: glycosyltransferase family 4 protein, partial [Lysinibacillus sp.]